MTVTLFRLYSNFRRHFGGTLCFISVTCAYKTVVWGVYASRSTWSANIFGTGIVRLPHFNSNFVQMMHTSNMAAFLCCGSVTRHCTSCITCAISRSQWSSGSTLAYCTRGPGIEPALETVSAFFTKPLRYTALVTGCTSLLGRLNLPPSMRR